MHYRSDLDLKNLKTKFTRPHNHPHDFYCPLCRIKRRIPLKPNPTAKHFAQVFLTAVVFMIATFSFFGFKGIVSFVPFWVVFEALYRMKVRALVPCQHCGFDPYLYLQDRHLAREEVELYWKTKFGEKGIEYPQSRYSKQKSAIETVDLTGNHAER